MFNPDNGSYNPDWAVNNVTLTPSLFRAGSAVDIAGDAHVHSIKWYDATNGIDGNSTPIATGGSYIVGTVTPSTLTIKGNTLAGLPGRDYMCEIVYYDDTIKMNLVYKTDISFSRVVNGGGIAAAAASCPNGNIFKNDMVSSILVQCDLLRGSVIDTTNVAYQWYQQDPTISDDQGGGIGWKKLSDVSNVAINTATNRMTVYPNAVENYAVFKCIITDTDTSSNTYNKTFMDTIAVVDQSDPFSVVVLSTGGNVFKNGVGSTTLTARLYRGDKEVDIDGKSYTYNWYKYGQDGVLDSNFGGTGVKSKTGKSIVADQNDVNVKATFMVEVS